jgi:putative redox protein
MPHKSRISWLGKMAFDAELNGHHFTIDATDTVGGENKGPRPKGLILTAIAGCTGMDVVSILKKMKVTDYKLDIDVSGELTTVHPIVYHTISVEFKFEGENLPADKLQKAVELSETRYCGVSAMMRKAVKMNTIIYINNEVLK